MSFSITSVVLAPVVLVAGTSAASDFKKGVEAFKERDGVTALKLLLPLAKNGNSRAQALVGEIYFEGSRIYPGIERDDKAAWFWIKLAADNGDVESQSFLGSEYLFATGNGEIPNDPKIGITWLLKAANKGYVPAICDLGLCYREGRGVPASTKESIAWYRKAAKQGDPAAMLWIGRMYAKGSGIVQDYVEALAWYILAASKSSDDFTSPNRERDELEIRLDSAQIYKGQQRAKEIAKELGL